MGDSRRHLFSFGYAVLAAIALCALVAGLRNYIHLMYTLIILDFVIYQILRAFTHRSGIRELEAISKRSPWERYLTYAGVSLLTLSVLGTFVVLPQFGGGTNAVVFFYGLITIAVFGGALMLFPTILRLAQALSKLMYRDNS